MDCAERSVQFVFFRCKVTAWLFMISPLYASLSLIAACGELFPRDLLSITVNGDVSSFEELLLSDIIKDAPNHSHGVNLPRLFQRGANRAQTMPQLLVAMFVDSAEPCKFDTAHFTISQK